MALPAAIAAALPRSAPGPLCAAGMWGLRGGGRAQQRDAAGKARTPLWPFCSVYLFLESDPRVIHKRTVNARLTDL